jgi:hypothetical protein
VSFGEASGEDARARRRQPAASRDHSLHKGTTQKEIFAAAAGRAAQLVRASAKKGAN